jgi:DNA-binding NarL/FixJ family response regulator
MDDNPRENLCSDHAAFAPKDGKETPSSTSQTTAEACDPKGLLSPRETEVLQAIVNGFSSAQIAKMLNISLETVKSHVKNILQKLQARDRTEAVVIALRASLVQLPR